MPSQEAKDRLVEGVRLLEVRQMGGVLQNDELRAGNVLVNDLGHLDGGGGIVRAHDDQGGDGDAGQPVG